MLTSLCIENFAIVSRLELDFANGMTALTGETGAGKSIMIDALVLALGGRADTTVIRPGADRCDIQANFLVEEHSPPAQWLAQHDIIMRQGEIILRRVMFAEGRSKSSINGVSLPLQKVQELSEMLVDIHGQHQHQSLLKHTTHRQQLDQYANHSALLEAVQGSYRECQVLREKIETLRSITTFKERADLLAFQLEELAQFDLQAGEMERLHQEHQLLHHAKAYLEQTEAILNHLQADDEPNIQQALYQVTHYLSSLPEDNPHVKNATELIQNAVIQCEEATRSMASFSKQIQLDPERLQIVEARMSTLHQLARKYHVDVTQLPAQVEQLKAEQANLQAISVELQQLQQDYQQSLAHYEAAARLLSESRRQQANPLAEEITQMIQQLGMPKGFVFVEITPLDKMQIHGLDKVEYKVCTNPGMEPDSLAKIASGGELSRISLGIQMITAQRGATPTLLFDEVDVGIGGATAALVGQLLRKLGERLQIFCVTHQPQVAAQAHHHFVVEKYIEDQQTFSRITLLTAARKIDEIARMLGGLTVTKQSRSNAKELLTAVD